MRFCALTLAALAAHAFAQAPAGERALTTPFAPTAAELLGHVRFLSSDVMAGRAAGSPQGAIAAAYIAAEFAKLGLQPAGDQGDYLQAFESASVTPEGDGKSLVVVRITGHNVLAWLPGSDPKVADQYLLVGAHFDHLGTQGEKVFNGADDNASGVAGLLGIARALVAGDIKPRRAVLFCAFDGEERGLLGSRYLAAHPPRPLAEAAAMVNLDMIGRATFLDRKALALPKRLLGVRDHPAVGVLGTAQSPELAAAVDAVCKADKLPYHAPEQFPDVLREAIEEQSAGRSDHAPFEEKKIPFVFFSTSENDDYHQPSDTLDKVDGETLRRIAAMVYRVVLVVDARDERPSFTAKEGG